MTTNILRDVRLMYCNRQQNLNLEIREAEQEGKDVAPYREPAAQIQAAPVSPEAEKAAIELCEALRHSAIRPDYLYREPESVQSIEALFPPELTCARPTDLPSRIHGALLGRAAGCLLGQPVECWMRERIVGLAKDTGNYPITRYFSSKIPEEVCKRYEVQDEPGAYGNKKRAWINNVDCAPEDDDLNYTLLALRIMEEYGLDFTSEDVAECLTLNLPVFLTCTAERMAYRNILNAILPPDSACYGNPYREWIGGQIRVDGYAYACAGRPTLAARMALRDASVSHTKNGLYAAVFCAALISLCAVCHDMHEAIEHALSFVPPKSRLREALEEFLLFERSGASDEALITYVHSRYQESDRHDWCLAIPNDLIVLLSLLRGGQDFTRVIGLATECGFDTDCNAATAGSAYGMMYGAAALPASWTEPMHGELFSRIGCGGRLSFQAISERFVRLADQVS
ncbi:MAG: ADP-ribosylglycohydrolase family protein [Clostridia bacterium]